MFFPGRWDFLYLTLPRANKHVLPVTTSVCKLLLYSFSIQTSFFLYVHAESRVKITRKNWHTHIVFNRFLGSSCLCDFSINPLLVLKQIGRLLSDRAGYYPLNRPQPARYDQYHIHGKRGWLWQCKPQPSLPQDQYIPFKNHWLIPIPPFSVVSTKQSIPHHPWLSLCVPLPITVFVLLTRRGVGQLGRSPSGDLEVEVEKYLWVDQLC